MLNLRDFIPDLPPEKPLSLPRKIPTVKHTPIKTQGIKSKLIQFIANSVEWGGDGCYHEPFIGSGIVLFNLRPRKAILSDINPHIINFYNNIKNKIISPRSLQKFLEIHGRRLKINGDAYYYEMRDIFNTTHDSKYFIFLSRCCFNGLMRFNSKGNFNSPFCKEKDRFSESYIKKITDQTRWVRHLIERNEYTFIHRDFSDSFANISEKDFVYLDPPYSSRDTGYFIKWSEEKDNQLIKMVNEANCIVALSTWKKDNIKENPFFQKAIDKIQDCKIREINHHYFVGAKEEWRNDIIEAIIIKMPKSIS